MLRLNVGEPRRETSAYDLVKHLAGSLRGGPSDLSTNPEHLKDMGQDVGCSVNNKA